MSRAKQGLMAIDFSHPLMDTSLAKIPLQKFEWDFDKDEIY